MGYVNPKMVCGLSEMGKTMIFKWCEILWSSPRSKVLAYRRTSLWHADLLLSVRDSQHWSNWIHLEDEMIHASISADQQEVLLYVCRIIGFFSVDRCGQPSRKCPRPVILAGWGACGRLGLAWQGQRWGREWMCVLSAVLRVLSWTFPLQLHAPPWHSKVGR